MLFYEVEGEQSHDSGVTSQTLEKKRISKKHIGKDARTCNNLNEVDLILTSWSKRSLDRISQGFFVTSRKKNQLGYQYASDHQILLL